MHELHCILTVIVVAAIAWDYVNDYPTIAQMEWKL